MLCRNTGQHGSAGAQFTPLPQPPSVGKADCEMPISSTLAMPCISKQLLFLKKDLFIRLKELRKEETLRDLPFWFHLPRWWQQPTLAQAKARSITWISHTGVRGPRIRAIFCSFFQATSRDLDWIWSTGDMNQWVYQPHHNVSPQISFFKEAGRAAFSMLLQIPSYVLCTTF